MAWLSGWEYRKDITLARASGLVTNYQMKLLVGESSGATGENVDCGGKCLSTFNDLRFTTSDGTTLLDYWIESISGTTPNQLATVWIEFDSIGTSDTTFYMYYGNSGASAASSGANTFIVFDDFERGSDGDTVGGDWTEITPHVHISTDTAYGGSKSAKFLGAASPGEASLPLNASSDISIMVRVYKENIAGMSFGHGDTPSRGLWLKWDTDDVCYFVEGKTYGSSRGSASHSAWHLFEFNNFNYSTQTLDFWIDGIKTGSSVKMNTASGSNIQDVLYINERTSTSDVDGYIDNVIVRNYRATEPAWGTWGAEEYDGSFTTESAVASDTMAGISPIEYTTESAEATDTFGNEKTSYVPTTESATATDSMDALHLVDSITESAVVSGSMEAAEMIRKRIKFPNLQGKHLSLKFTSATDGSFAIYYLRHKMFKTRELCSDQKHPNTHGSHLGLKLHNTGTDDFILMYVSEKMQLVTT